MNKYTIEELEKIIGEATKGAVYYHPATEGYYTKSYSKVGFCGVSLMPYHYGSCLSIDYLQKQLQEMKMQESQAMQVEIENTAQQVESLAGSALTMSERDIEDAIDGEWNGEGFPPLGIECVFTPDNTCWGFNYAEAFTGTVIHYEGEQFVFMLNHKKYNLEDSNLVISRTDKGEFSLSLTPEQKQAQIDKDKAIRLHDLANENYPACAQNDWESATIEVKEMCLAVAKYIEFK